jgi:cyclophilin family peptidyl-prolyl cis-trans isomerase
MTSAQMKYAEVQAVAGGVTAVQGSPSSGTDAWDSMLSRNVELYNFGQDGMSTCAVCGSHEDDYTGSHLISQNESGSLNAWFVHLSEGVDASSKAEFESLYEKGLIMDETVVIHGTALDESQFTKMAEKGAGLVWSPISNLLLYGDTTDVVAADNSGVTISLAPDWGPSGSKSNLHELKTADLWNTDVLNGHFSDYELVQMVTSNPAEISNWQDFVGQIEVDMYADLVVIDTFHANPYRNLIEAIDRDVLLTIVQGKAVFGDVDLMTDLQGNDWEYINGSGFSKAIDVTSVSVEDGSQTWESIESGLAMAMRNEVGDIREHWSEVSDLNTDQEVQDYLDSKFDGDYNDGVSHLRNLTLDPIFTMNDDRYFDVINRSAHANFHVDMSKLYDYYNVAYDAASSRPFIDSDFTPPAQDVNGCTDSTATNYDSSATVDNGSCTYVDNGGDDIDDIGDVIDDFIFNSTDPIVVVMEVQFEGSKSGTITFELYPDKAPYHVDNILRHIDAGNYDGAIFHRVIDNFMIQGGDFENNIGTGGFAAGWYGYCNGQESQENSCVQTSWTVPDEADNGLSHEPGALSMAKTAMPHTGGSQFFIVDEEGGQYHLDGIHTVFGMVIDGMDVVDDISETDTTYTDKPVEDVVIVSFSRADENSSELTTPTSPSSDSSSSWIQIGIIVASIVILFSIAMMSSMMRGPEMGGSHGGSDQYFKSGVERQEAMTDIDLDTDLDLDKPDVGKP